MLKALMKKQFLELNSFYFRNRRTGQHRSKAGTVGFILLFALLFVYLMVVFFMLAQSLAGALIGQGFGWLYYALMGLIALAFGVLGSVFNTYAGLFHAKDNDLLLSMPIPPRWILIVRMVGVYAMSMLYTCIVMIPTIVAGQLAAPAAWPLISQILLTLLLGFVVLALTCFLGWIVALISSRLKNKSYFTVIFTLIFLALYYFVYFRISVVLKDILKYTDVLERFMHKLYPVYTFGRAGEGSVLNLLVFALIALALGGLCLWIMSRSFLRIVTMNQGEGGKKKTEYRPAAVPKASGTAAALLRKELRRFAGSPTWILNCGLGLVIMVIAAVAALIKQDFVRESVALIAERMPGLAAAVPVLAGVGVIALAAMNPISAPSVSLEGKAVWILQTLPVRAADVLNAKLRLHLILSAGPTLLIALSLAVVLDLGFSIGIFTVVLALLATMFFAQVGLALNLLRPNLSWTNEVVPIKQSVPVLTVIFGGWLVAGLVAGGYFLLRRFCGTETYLIGCIVVFAVLIRLLNRWIMNQGAERFDTL